MTFVTLSDQFRKCCGISKIKFDNTFRIDENTLHKSTPWPIRRVNLHDSNNTFYSPYGQWDLFVKAPLL